MSGAVVSGLQPVRQGTERFLDFFFRELWAEESSANENRTKKIRASEMPKRDAEK
jgi:hypothetical protein